MSVAERTTITAMNKEKPYKVRKALDAETLDSTASSTYHCVKQFEMNPGRLRRYISAVASEGYAMHIADYACYARSAGLIHNVEICLSLQIEALPLFEEV